MEISDQYLFECKMEYIKSVLLIIRTRYDGDSPSNQLLSQARKLGQLIGVSAEELNNL